MQEKNKDLEFILDNLNEKNLKKYASTHLNAQKQAQLKEILNDKDKMNKVLSSKQAREIMRKLKGSQNGQH